MLAYILKWFNNIGLIFSTLWLAGWFRVRIRIRVRDRGLWLGLGLELWW